MLSAYFSLFKEKDAWSLVYTTSTVVAVIIYTWCKFLIGRTSIGKIEKKKNY